MMADDREIATVEKAAKGKSGEAVCPVWTGKKICGRKLHIGPDTTDEQPVCLMHSKDPNKQSGALFDAFWTEFERILKDAGEGEADCERVVFPFADLSGREFLATCRFNKATFTQGAYFSGARFLKDANFSGAAFQKGCSFSGARFLQDADFSDAAFQKGCFFNYASFARNAAFHRAIFTQDADFRRAIFTQGADFSGASFQSGAFFHTATFQQEARFRRAIFTGEAFFSGAGFTGETDFFRASFTQGAEFIGTTFQNEVKFIGVAFTQEAQFTSAVFAQNADFSYATFTQAARFADTEFRGTVNLRRIRFLDQAEFRRTKFDPQIAGQPSAVFALASFAKPEEILFDDVDLSRVLFHNCDVSQVRFSSSARWGRREGQGGLTVFEETIPLEQELERGPKRDGQRDYWAVSHIYTQLKKNYDAGLDYWTANEFHFGEMEMKRLAGPTSGRLLGLRRWRHRNLSLVALYRHASNYGNSYWKPGAWLLGTLVLFAALLPLPGVGLKRQETRQVETYASVWEVSKSARENLWAEAGLAGKGAIASVDTATFQKSAEYAPNYPCGRVLAIAESLLTATLFGLFLLAIRRQFRR
jgi:uncharacterized protein YjbI with pentapeptide repeats